MQGPARCAVLADGSEVGCHAVLIATGVSYRRLDVPGIDALVGLGVYYGATVTEAMAHSDQDVYIVGGANSAGQAAVATARYARSVTMLVRGESLADTMSHYLIDQIEETPNVAVRLRTSVRAVAGSPALETITLQRRRHGRDGDGSRGRALHLHRRRAAHRLAGGRGRPRRPRVRLLRTGRAGAARAGRLAAGTAAVLS